MSATVANPVAELDVEAAGEKPEQEQPQPEPETDSAHDSAAADEELEPGEPGRPEQPQPQPETEPGEDAEEAGAGRSLADVGAVQWQLRCLGKLHAAGGGPSALAYAGYAVLLFSWFVAPAWLSTFAADGNEAVCGEGRIELDGTGAVHLQAEDTLCHGGSQTFLGDAGSSYTSSGIVHAADVCEAVGARLCTLAEVVEANVAWAGCEKDIGSPVHFTWTSSQANAAGTRCPPGQHMSAPTNPHVLDNHPPVCTPDTTDL
eukprot:COSAG04_NODE_6217_length_1382_cov_1.348402_1_plen_260_part_00